MLFWGFNILNFSLNSMQNAIECLSIKSYISIETMFSNRKKNIIKHKNMILKLQYGNLHIAEKKELKNNGR